MYVDGMCAEWGGGGGCMLCTCDMRLLSAVCRASANGGEAQTPVSQNHRG